MTDWLVRQIGRLPFGDVTRRALIEAIADHCYERGGGWSAVIRVVVAAAAAWAGEANPLRSLGGDARAAVRRLRRSPAFVVFAVGTLAVAIGSTTAVYSVIYAALYRQQPIPRLAQVMNIYQSDMRAGASGPLTHLSPHDFEDLSASQTVFSSMAAWSRFSGTLIAPGVSEPILGEMVTGSYFSLLGVNAAVGRVLQAADAAPGAPDVIVLSDGLWRRLFGGDPSVVGRTVRFQGQPFQIVGVAPAWFRGSDMPNLLPTPAWIPLRVSRAIDPASAFGPLPFDRRALLLKARLRDGVTLGEARAQVTAISQRIAIADPERRSQRDRSGRPPVGWFVLPMADLRLHESVHAIAGPMASALMGAVLLVLLVGCSNLTNLTLARAARRKQEIAVRIALGASRFRILREQLVESALIAVGGWSLGLLVAFGLMKFLGQSIEMHAAFSLTLQLVPTLNLSVLVISIVATAITVVVVGLGPAIRQTRSHPRGAIAADGLAVAPRWRMRATLVVGQVAVSVALLALSTLCLRELRASTDHDPGFALDKLALIQLDFSANGYDSSRVRQELDAMSAIVRRAPGVDSVALTTALPVGSGRPAAAAVGVPDDPAFLAADRQNRPSAAGGYPMSARWMAVAGPVFDTLGIRLVAGRALSDRDDERAAPVAVVSEGLARALYPHGAIGRPLAVRRMFSQPEKPTSTVTIVGVVADTDVDSFGASASRRRYAVYLPWSQIAEPYVSVVARTSDSPAALIGPMRAASRQVDPEVAVAGADTGFGFGGPAVLVLQVMGGIAGTLGLFALVLAVAGLYGVLADVVTRRTREIGIRVALGASRQGIHRMVLVDGLWPVAIGAAIGLTAAYFAMITLPAFVFLWRMQTAGLGSMAMSIVPLTIAAIVASYVPARRAARVDPNVALREL